MNLDPSKKDFFHSKGRESRRAKIQADRQNKKVIKERGYHKKRKEKRRVYVNNNWKKIKLQQRLAYHRMTEDQYDALLKKQGGSCAICKDKDWKGRSPHIDHNHKTGQVRGLLCRSCNSGIGMFKDDSKICRKAAYYIESAQE